MDPVGYIVGVRLAHDNARSALPDAPVVPDRPRRAYRPPRTIGLRQNAAITLRNIASWVEPKHDGDCQPALH